MFSTRNANPSDDQKLTDHATARMARRGIQSNIINLVFEYGRPVYTRGAMIYAIGRREVEQYRLDGIDLSRCEGVQVVCAKDGAVLTVYRNRNFRRLRIGLGRGRFRPDRAAKSRQRFASE